MNPYNKESNRLKHYIGTDKTHAQESSDHVAVDPIEVYKEAINGRFQNLSCELVRKSLGNPDRKGNLQGYEIWYYGPSLKVIKAARSGDIVGATFYIDQSGKVIKCGGVFKDM